MKKLFKIIGVLIVLLIGFVAAAPYLFEDQIKELIKESLNNQLNAKVDFEDADLSLWRSFPNAQVSIKKISIVNYKPFEGDTLLYSKAIKLALPVSDLWNEAGEPVSIKGLTIENALVNVLVNKQGVANYDITKESVEDTAETTVDNDSGLSFDLQSYTIKDSKIRYEDLASKNTLILSEFNHSGDGDFSAISSELDTETETKVYYKLDDVEFLSNQVLKLDAVIMMDLENQKFTFEENEAYINDLKLNFNGFVDVEEDHNMVDISFKTPSSDFKNFLDVIPATYKENIGDITTTGDFSVEGVIKGRVDDDLIPTMDIKVVTKNGSVNYPDLPRSIDKIALDMKLLNTTGKVEDTYIDIKNVGFNLGSDRLTGNASIKNLTTNMLVDLAVKGKLDLGNLSQALPQVKEMDLDGELVADLKTRFDMESIDKERYQNIKSNGNALLTNFKYINESLNNPLFISKADINFDTAQVRLKEFVASTGDTDFNASGSLNNLLGFMFKDQDLKGNFNLKSDQFKVSDFMTEPVAQKGEPAPTSTEEAVKIPSFLNAQLDFAINKVFYDNLTLTNVTGVAIIRDETLTLNNVQSDIFNGKLGLNGSVSTKGDQSIFDMAVDMSKLNIAQAFTGFEMFQQLAPVLKIFKGALNSDLKLKGNLNKDMTPDITTMGGSAFAQIITQKIQSSESPLISKLDQQLNFIDLDKVSVQDIAANLTFDDGKVNVKPFNFKIQDINVTAGGSHSLTNSMDYTLTLDLPASYLGSQGANLLSNLSDQDVEGLVVPLPIKLGGSFTQPVVNMNLKGAVSDLTSQIVNKQKEELKEKGKDAAANAINDAVNGKNPLDGIKDVLKGSSSDKKDDKEKSKTKTEDKVKDAINGLFGK